MRPRFMNRGSLKEALDRPIRLSASMRPRFMNRGSAKPGEALRSSAERFNEAPIHESGKFWIDAAAIGAAKRFNEAPIHESGK